MKKILFVLDDLDMGGAEKVNLIVANGLISRGYSVSMFLRRNKVEYQGLVGDVPLQFYRDSGEIGSLVDPALFFRLAQAAKSCDVIVGGLEFAANILALSTKFMLGKPVFACIHSMINERLSISKRRQYYLCKIVYPNVEKVIAPSRSALRSLAMVCSPANPSVIPNPVDLDKISGLSNRTFQRPHSDDPRIKLCFCGRLDPEKNLRAVLSAMLLLGSRVKEFLLIVIGDGLERSEMENFVNLHSLGSHVLFAGKLANPYPAMAACDLLISTSPAESFSMVICEAMALGVPCVSYGIEGDGRTEIIEDGKNGFFISPTPEALAAFLLKFVGMRFGLLDVVAAARKRVEEFSVANTLDLWEDALSEFI